MAHTIPTEQEKGRAQKSVIPRLLDLNAAAELLQHILSGVMIDNEHTIFLIRPFVPFEHGHWWCGPLFATKV